MKHAILLTHGSIGDAIIEAVDGIMGMNDGLFALSVTNMSVSEITQRVLAIVNGPDEKQDGVVIMASLKGGSCWNVAVSVCNEQPNVRVVSGVNLPMVLTFMTKRDTLTLDELVATLVDNGVRGIEAFDKV
jgi:PTS system mannose-specific IIA component